MSSREESLLNQMINKLENNEIFVFGSNLAGKHLGGAAKQAKEMFGASDGVGEGLTGKCYAFPTLDSRFKKVTKRKLMISIFKLYICCLEFPKRKFLLTKVGCGIAGFKEDKIKSIFKNYPENLILPSDWKL